VLAVKDPENSAYYLANLNKFIAEIRKLDAYMAAGAAKFRVKEVVTFHPSWVYFERRYGLKEAAVIETTPGREPSPRELVEIVDKIKKYRLKTIFAETTLPRKAADVIAREAGVKVLVLNPEGGEGESYAGFMKNNFSIMKEAMQ
jgi:ABC-type Zn uptake system ZnuABC Zn-binding protein ZnuA